MYCIGVVYTLYRYPKLRVSRTVLVSTHFPVFEILIMNHPPRNVKFPFVSSQRFPSTRVIKTSTAQKRTQETRYDDCKAFPKPLTQNLISVFVSHLSSQYNVEVSQLNRNHNGVQSLLLLTYFYDQSTNHIWRG